MAAMAARQPPQTETAGTLGDVLYAGVKAPAPESDWVRLVRSVAERDQLALHALYERESIGLHSRGAHRG